MRLRKLGQQLPKVLVIVTLLLVVASGAVLADPDHNDGTPTTTATTTSHTESGSHHDEGTTTHTETEGNNHADDGHHSSTETASDGHANEESSHHSGESSDDHHEGESNGDHHDTSTTEWATSIAGLFALAALPTVPAYWFGKQQKRFSGIGGLELTAIGLILISAAVHLYLFLQHSEVQMLLAGVGFLGAIVLFFVGVSHRLLYLVGIPYIAAQIVLWWMAGMPHLQTYGLLDKIAQVLLIGILGYLLWTEWNAVDSK
jgi:hypothetical protein